MILEITIQSEIFMENRPNKNKKIKNEKEFKN